MLSLLRAYQVRNINAGVLWAGPEIGLGATVNTLSDPWTSDSHLRTTIGYGLLPRPPRNKEQSQQLYVAEQTPEPGKALTNPL